MKCVVVFCHAVAQDLVCDVLERQGCRHYVGVGRAFARDDDERRFDSRYHPGADVVVMAFVQAERVADVTAAIRAMSTGEGHAHVRIAVLPVDQFA